MKSDIKERFAENAKGEDMAMYDQTMGSASELSGDEVEAKPSKKYKFRPETYQFISIDKGASFTKVLEEMRMRCIEVSDFLNRVEGSYEDGQLKTVDDYFWAIALEIANDCPRLLEKVNIHTMFSVSANKLYVRMENNIAFGFNITYKVYNGVARLEYVVGTITMYDDRSELREELLGNGWRKEDKQKRNR